MKLTSKPKELIPAGTYTAILYSIVDLGSQKNTFNPNASARRRVRLTWELCDELMEDGRPLSIGKEFTASAHKKSTIVSFLSAWTGAPIQNGFELSDMLGQACNLTVSHEVNDSTGEEYATISNIAPLKKSEKAPPAQNKLTNFDLDNFNPSAFGDLPEWLQEKIRISPEYMEALNPSKPVVNSYTQAQPADDMAQDIPF